MFLLVVLFSSVDPRHLQGYFKETKHVGWLDEAELGNTPGIYSQSPMSPAVRTYFLHLVQGQLLERGMHIAPYLCCNLFRLLGGDLLALCFQGKKTRTLNGKKITSITTFFLSH